MGHREFVVDLVKQHGYKSFVEIGVWKGRLSAMVAPLVDELILIDPWDYGLNQKQNMHTREKLSQQKMERIYKAVMGRLPNATIYRMTSVEASKQIADQSIDFVFIDACHSYESVTEDIQYWLPKVKPGGMIAGDDFLKPYIAKHKQQRYPKNWDFSGVFRAVNDFFGADFQHQKRVWFHQVRAA